MEQTTDVVIVGGGVIGCAIAYYLSKAGMSTCVLEQGEVGAQASSAAAGLLAPLGPLSGPGPFADLLLSSFALFPSVVPELEEATGLRLNYDQTGALRVVRNPKRVSNLQKRMQAWQPLGLKMYWLTGEEARQREPLLSEDVSAAIYAPEESQIQAPQVVKAFAKAAENLGAEISSHKKVVNILKKEKRVTGVQLAEGETISCNHLVLTTGAWSCFYGEWLDLDIPVTPLQGQIIILQQPSQPLQHIIFGDAIYLTPKEKSILVGATKEEVGFEAQVTAEGKDWLNTAATRLVPVLKQSRLENAWAGLRPKTVDTRPIIGPAPHWENVTLAAGHNAVGIILSPLTGQAVATSITTGQVPDIIRPFSLERFTKTELNPK